MCGVRGSKLVVDQRLPVRFRLEIRDFCAPIGTGSGTGTILLALGICFTFALTNSLHGHVDADGVAHDHDGQVVRWEDVLLQIRSLMGTLLL